MKTPGHARRWATLGASLAFAQFACTAFAQTQAATGTEHWIPTWVTAPQAVRAPARPPQAAASGQPAATARPAAPITGLNNQTVRMIVHTSIAGHRIRVQLSNVYSTKPLMVGAAHVALRRKDSALAPGSDRVLMFSGKPSFSIPPGAIVTSDAVELEVPALSDLAVSVYTPGETGPATMHSTGLHTMYISKQGDTTGQPEMADALTSQSWFWLTGVEVVAPADAAAVVTFGDSITDGTRSTPNTDSTWPSFLAKRLNSNPATAHIAVLNEGIGGNRVLQDGLGAAGLARFDRDVLMQPGVKWVTVMEGINDIGAGIGEAFVFGPRTNAPASETATPDDIIGGYRQMIERAHTHGVKVIGGTLTPYEGAAYYSEAGNTTRIAVNQWIRTSHAFDAVVDFDAVIRSPESPNKFRPEFDSGDHLHPNDAGYKAMADAVDLSIFSPKTMRSSASAR